MADAAWKTARWPTNLLAERALQLLFAESDQVEGCMAKTACSR
jgi:hypothetical protein